MHRLTEIVGGIGEVRRDAEFVRTGFAGDGGDRVLCCATTAQFLHRALAQPATAAVVVPPELAAEVPEEVGIVVAEDAEMAFWRIHNEFAALRPVQVAVEPFVDPSARIHPDAHVEPGCRIGRDVVVDADVMIHAGTVLEDGAHVRFGAILGCEGTMCKRRPGTVLQVAHVGGVHVGAGAQIFARALIQRGVFAKFTRIGARAAMAADSFVSHETSIGDDTTVSYRAAIAGFTTIGERVWIGPNAIVSNLLEIGDDARVEIGAVVVRSIPAGARYSGLFARPHRLMRRMSLALADLAGRSPET